MGFFTAEDARQARKDYIENKKKEAFNAVACTEEFTDLLDDIRFQAMNGQTKYQFLPRSTEYYQALYDKKETIPEESMNFTEAQYKAFDALRELGYSVNYLKPENAVGNAGVLLNGMNPFAGDTPLQIAQCTILWG